MPGRAHNWEKGRSCSGDIVGKLGFGGRGGKATQLWGRVNWTG